MSKIKIGEEQMSDEYYDLERRTEIKAASNRLKKQFLTWRECEIVYSLQHRKLLKLADEAGAIYRFDGVVLINREIFEAYLKQFRQELLALKEMLEEYRLSLNGQIGTIYIIL